MQLEDAAMVNSVLAVLDKLLSFIGNFSRSGLFFMLFGTGFLWFAHDNIQRANSAFTFVIVVLGAAMVLYGSGTQALGEMANDDEKNKLKVQIAGGAGILSLVIAFGVINYSEKMKTAFRVQKKFIVIPIELKKAIGFGDPVRLAEYSIVEAFVNGEPVPVLHGHSYFNLYAPYFDNDKKSIFRIQFKIKHKNLSGRLSHMVESKDIDTALNIDAIDNSSGFEFPRNKNSYELDLIVDQSSKGVKIFSSDGAFPESSFKPL